MGLFDFMKPNKKTAKSTAIPPQAARSTKAPQELELGLDNLLMSEDQDWDEVEFPDEEHVLAVAAAWGVDPRMESHSGETSTGFIGVKRTV